MFGKITARLRYSMIVLGAIVAVTGCASSRQARDGEPLKPNQGLLAVHVTSNADAYVTYVDYIEESTFANRFGEQLVGAKGWVDLKAGNGFQLIPIDAGEYTFSKLNVYPRFAWLQSTNRFRVEANTITYIGHIRMHVSEQGFKLDAFDEELAMRTYLAETYPAYFGAMGLRKAVVELNLR